MSVIHEHISMDRYGGDLLIEWTEEDQQQALSEGWYLDENDGAFLHDEDNGTFTDSNEVAEHVRIEADRGSRVHIKALIIDLYASARAWEERLESAFS